METIISNNALRDYLTEVYGSGDKNALTEEDLNKVEFLEITTEEHQFWDEGDISLVTGGFWQLEDLEHLPNLKVLVLQGQPIRGTITLPNTIEEVFIVECRRLHLIIGKDEFEIPPSKRSWYWKRGRGVL